MKVEGTAAIGLKYGDVVIDLDGFVDRLTRYVNDEVLPRLEPFLA